MHDYFGMVGLEKYRKSSACYARDFVRSSTDKGMNDHSHVTIHDKITKFRHSSFNIVYYRQERCDRKQMLSFITACHPLTE